MTEIKGYPVSAGYMGWIGAGWMLFATEEEYKECIKEKEEDYDE